MKIEVYNLENKKVGTAELPDRIFGAQWNPDLVHQVLVAQLANRRKPWAHAKDRSEVRGGGRKPWRQKGTGRARHGSIRSPIWRGGGKAHGPTREKVYAKKINKKMRRLAIFSVLSKKIKDKDVKFFDNLMIENPKTKALSLVLRPLLNLKKTIKKYDLLIVPDLEEKNLIRAANNLTKVKVLKPDSLNVYDLLNYKNIFVDQKAIEVIASHYKI